MRCTRLVLAVVALAAMAGCAHPAAPLAASAMLGSGARTLAAAGDPEHAQEIVTRKFTDKDTQVESVEVVATEVPKVYSFVCAFRRLEFGQMCEYEAKGQVDVVTEKITSKHRVRMCLGDAKKLP